MVACDCRPLVADRRRSTLPPRTPLLADRRRRRCCCCCCCCCCCSSSRLTFCSMLMAGPCLHPGAVPVKLRAPPGWYLPFALRLPPDEPLIRTHTRRGTDRQTVSGCCGYGHGHGHGCGCSLPSRSLAVAAHSLNGRPAGIAHLNQRGSVSQRESTEKKSRFLREISKAQRFLDQGSRQNGRGHPQRASCSAMNERGRGKRFEKGGGSPNK